MGTIGYAQYVTVKRQQETNGLITATSNGTGLATGLLEEGVFINTSNVTVQNLAVTNMYQRTIGTDYFTGMASFAGVYAIGTGISSLLISNCTISAAYDGVALTFNNSSTFEIKNCNISNCAVDASIGQNNINETLTGVLVHNNYMSTDLPWEGSPSIHRDCIHLFNVNGTTGQINGAQIYDNIFTGDLGNNISTYILLEGWLSGPLII